MNTPSGDSIEYVDCQRCGRSIPKQSAIEEDGMLLCGECLVKDVKRDVSKAEAQAEQERQQQRQVQLEEARRQQRRRALIIFCACVAALLIALGLTYLNREEPVPTRTVSGEEHPDVVRSMLIIGIHKYQNEHRGNPPASLNDLSPDYVDSSLDGTFELFRYAVQNNGKYTLELKRTSDTLDEKPQAAKNTQEDL